MGMFDNEVAADNQMRRFDQLSSSPLRKAVAGGNEAFDALSNLASPDTLGRIVGGLKLLDLIHHLGVPTVDDNLDFLGSAVEQALSRLESRLNSQEKSTNDFQERLKSKEFIDTLSSAVLQTQRTNDRNRLNRLALIVTNCVDADDLGTEDAGDLMRAAVELNEFDLKVLKEIYDAQRGLLLSYQRLDAQWAGQVAASWASKFGIFDSPKWIGTRGSLAKLQSFGFISQVATNMVTSGELRTQAYGLLPDGKKFFERIQELAA